MNKKPIVTIITFAGLFFALNVSAQIPRSVDVPPAMKKGLWVEAFDMNSAGIQSSSPQSESNIGKFSAGVPPFTGRSFSRLAAEAEVDKSKFTGAQWSGFIKTEVKGTHGFTLLASGAPVGANCLADIAINNKSQTPAKFSKREREAIKFQLELQIGMTPVSIWLNCASESSDVNVENVRIELLQSAPGQRTSAPIARDKYYH